MQTYILRFNAGGKNYLSEPVKADTPRQAMKVFRGRFYATLKGWSDFHILDNIGVVKDSKELDKGA